MTLTEYLNGMRNAQSAAELEAAIQADFKHTFYGKTWARISNVRIEAGQRICRAHPDGRFVPICGKRRKLELCGETYGVGYGGNSTGERYVWHDAKAWAVTVLMRNGFSRRAGHQIWDGHSSYPHRSLETARAALRGEIPDPTLNVLIPWKIEDHGRPVRCTVAEARNEGRAMRPCDCGGTLLDWGVGHSQGFEFVNWHCNACPAVHTEYMMYDQLMAMRQEANKTSRYARPLTAQFAA